MSKPLTLAVAAGKGGTGKTLIATSLARALVARHPYGVQLIDCDVEEPNADLLLQPRITHNETVSIQVPEVNKQACIGCGKCAEACQYSAIAVMNKTVITFHELCSGCGVCSWVCPVDAIREVPLRVGMVSTGRTEDGLEFCQGRTDVGLQRTSTVTKATKSHQDPELITIIDAPPGTACPMQETVEDADFALLVTEPTPFGLHDLEMAVDTCKSLDVPMGIIVNRDMGDFKPLEDFSRSSNVPILLRIPQMREVAEAYSRGITLVDVKPEYASQLVEIYDAVVAGHDRVAEQSAGSEADA